MARSKAATKPAPVAAPAALPMGHRQSTRLIVLLLGLTLLLGALVAPWWTRGMDVDEEKLDEATDGDGGSFGFAYLVPGAEGLYLNYAPFRTPGQGTVTYDAGREAATSVLGLGLVACLVFAGSALLVRWLMVTGRLEENLDAPVRLAIVAFIAGVFAVLWGAFFLPLAGDNPGMLYGDERPSNLGDNSDGILETTRYANVGFFLGIVGAVGFPAYVWLDASRTRAVLLGSSPATAGVPA